MENKINIAELLKDYPKGMELYSPIFGKVYLDKIRPHLAIVVTTDKEQGDFKEEFLYDGRYGMNGECMLFPSKEKTTWEGFQPPFKDGDIVSTTDGNWVGITTGGKKGEFIPVYCVIMPDGNFEAYLDKKEQWVFNRLATEEEKQKLFDVIKGHGYKWNAETKTLEKLVKPKFKVGDIIRDIIGICKVKITKVNIKDECYLYKSLNINGIGSITFNRQDDWELVPNKFDINNLKPFDKVLVRSDNSDIWQCDFFSLYNPKCSNRFHCIGAWYNICIPYIGNEHLLGTTDDCDEYFKNWEE